MFLGSILKKKSVAGYIRNNLFEPISLKLRHDALASEMQARRYNHKTPLDFSLEILNYLEPDQMVHRIDQENSFRDLTHRCNVCMNNALNQIHKVVREGFHRVDTPPQFNPQITT
jgi:hypothetical protein